MKDEWEISLGWGDVVNLNKDGTLMIGNPHRNNHWVTLQPHEMRWLAKRLLKVAGELS